LPSRSVEIAAPVIHKTKNVGQMIDGHEKAGCAACIIPSCTAMTSSPPTGIETRIGERKLWLRALINGSDATARIAINQIRYLVAALRERSIFSPAQATLSKRND
jgi:hypothetical protein